MEIKEEVVETKKKKNEYEVKERLTLRNYPNGVVIGDIFKGKYEIEKEKDGWIKLKNKGWILKECD